MTLSKRAQLMRVIALILAGYALIWGLAPYELINWPARALLAISAWDLSSIAEPLNQQAQWLSAIGSGLLMAVAIVAYSIIAPAILQNNRNILRNFSLAIAAWYLLDSVGSIAANVSSNVLFNTLYLALIYLPLWGMRLFPVSKQSSIGR